MSNISAETATSAPLTLPTGPPPSKMAKFFHAGELEDISDEEIDF